MAFGMAKLAELPQIIFTRHPCWCVGNGHSQGGRLARREGVHGGVTHRRREGRSRPHPCTPVLEWKFECEQCIKKKLLHLWDKTVTKLLQTSRNGVGVSEPELLIVRETKLDTPVCCRIGFLRDSVRGRGKRVG